MKIEEVDLNVPIINVELKDDELAHFGVKGMRWGVRRSDEELARIAGRKQQAFDNKINRTKTKLAVREQKAKVKIEEAKAKQQSGDALKKLNEAKKIREESRAKIKADKLKVKEDNKRHAQQQKKEAVRAKMEESKDTKKTSTKFKPEDAKYMTDEELRSVVSRMNLEAQYSKLNPVPPSKLKQTMATVGTIAVTTKGVVDMLGGTQAVYTAITGRQQRNSMRPSRDMSLEEMQAVINRTNIVSQYDRIRSSNTTPNPVPAALDQALSIAAALGRRRT